MVTIEPEQERRESVKDILNLGFTAHLESRLAPDLPQSQEEAIRFQEENLAAAVSSYSSTTTYWLAQVVGASRAQSRVGSLGPSRFGSLACSRVTSRVGSRMGSRSIVASASS